MRQFYVNALHPPRPPGNGPKASIPAEALREANPDCQPTIEVLLESDHDFKLLLNNIPAVVFKGYVDGSVDFFDQKIEALTGYPRKDFESRQRKWTELVLEEDFEAVKQAFVHALKTDKSYVREYRIRNRNNKFLWIQERSQIICDQSGKVQYVSGIFFDITSQKQTEEALQEGERFLSGIFGSILDGISVIDSNFTIVQVNPTMEKWYSTCAPSRGEKVLCRLIMAGPNPVSHAPPIAPCSPVNRISTPYP